MNRPAQPPVAEQVGVGFVVALVASLAELVVAAFRSTSQVPATAWILGGLHLITFELPIGVAVGAAVGAAIWALRATPWSEPVKRRFSGIRRLFAADPEGFSTGLGALAAAAGFVLVARIFAEQFATRYHAPALAAWAMAWTALALVAAAVLMTAIVAAVVRPLARRMGRAASVGVIVVLTLIAAVAAASYATVRFPLLMDAYDPIEILWLPGVAVVYVLVAWGMRRVWARVSARSRLVRIVAATCVVVAAGGIVWTGATYGRSNVVRVLIERRTVMGLRLVRGYMDATDRDGDGYSFAFGGGDCDDSNPHVHPGAYDKPGDGIDEDCFAGDGDPPVADLGDGHYGKVPGLTRPNILLITIDALRESHLGTYGYDRPTSPNMDAFAKNQIKFDNVIAQSSRSIRSMPAFMTGFYPSQIAYGDQYLWPALLPQNITLAEALRDAGYQTAVTMGTNYFERMSGFFQGFQHVDEIPIYRPPRAMPVTHAIAELAHLIQNPKPWFMWVHLFNVHEEYLWDHHPSKFGNRPVDKYDTEITLADQQVGRLLDAVKKRGLFDHTVVLITADHGEAFGEHNDHGHSTNLYDEELRVPFLIHVPGVHHEVIKPTVALFDLMPTLLNLAGVPVPKPMPARSLVPLITGEGKPPKNRLIFSEILPDGLYPYDQKAIRRNGMKLIWWVREGTFQLFNLRKDPGEHHDLSDSHRAEAKRMLGLLRAWVAETSRPEQRDSVVIQKNRLAHAPTHMTRTLDLRFPGFTLLGFDMPKHDFLPGDDIAMTFYYHVDAPIDDNYFFYVDIKGPRGYPVAPHFHAHHFPMNGRYRTYEWHTGEILRDPVDMIVPRDVAHPLQLKIDLTVLDRQRRMVPFVDPTGHQGFTVDLARAEIH